MTFENVDYHGEVRNTLSVGYPASLPVKQDIGGKRASCINADETALTEGAASRRVRRVSRHISPTASRHRISAVTRPVIASISPISCSIVPSLRRDPGCRGGRSSPVDVHSIMVTWGEVMVVITCYVPVVSGLSEEAEGRGESREGRPRERSRYSRRCVLGAG